jgi:hypothetical protein
MCEEMAIEPYVFPYFGSDVAILFAHTYLSEDEKAIADAVTHCFGHRCNACIKRAQYLSTLSGVGRSRFNPAARCPAESPVNNLAHILTKLADEITQRQICGVYIVPHGQKFVGNFNPHDGSRGDHKFLHFAMATTKASSKNAKIEMLQKGLDTLLFQSSIFSNLVGRIKNQGVDSLKLFASVCDTSTYGEKTFGHATRWMMKIVEGGSSSVENFIRHIFDAGLSYVGLMNVDCTLRHTADQIITILEDPLTKSFDGLKTLLAQRADPLAYRRTTAPPTEGQLKMALDALKDFRAQVMTVEYAKTLPGYTSFENAVVTSDTAGSLIQDMLLKTQSLKISQPTSFAARMKTMVGPELLRNTIRELTTMQSLLAFMKEHPGARLVLESGGSACYHATCTFGKDVNGDEKVGLAEYMPGYIWGFGGCSLGWNGLGYNSDDDQYIVGVMHTKTSLHNNYVFITAPTRRTFSVSSGCFFPEFMHSSITRTCGSTFEALKKEHAKVMSIPAGQLMAGKGFSVADKSTKLYMPASVRITLDGITEKCTITHESKTM